MKPQRELWKTPGLITTNHYTESVWTSLNGELTEKFSWGRGVRLMHYYQGKLYVIKDSLGPSGSELYILPQEKMSEDNTPPQAAAIIPEDKLPKSRIAGFAETNRRRLLVAHYGLKNIHDLEGRVVDPGGNPAGSQSNIGKWDYTGEIAFFKGRVYYTARGPGGWQSLLVKAPHKLIDSPDLGKNMCQLAVLGDEMYIATEGKILAYNGREFRELIDFGITGVKKKRRESILCLTAFQDARDPNGVLLAGKQMTSGIEEISISDPSSHRTILKDVKLSNSIAYAPLDFIKKLLELDAPARALQKQQEEEAAEVAREKKKALVKMLRELSPEDRRAMKELTEEEPETR